MEFRIKITVLWLAISGISRFAQAQVPVSQEPRHHKILENGHIRLLDVHIMPGDTSAFHIHATPSVFVILSPVKTGSDVIQEEVRAPFTVPRNGNIYFEGFYHTPRIHRVWNSDTSEFRVMDIELTNKNFIIPDSLIRDPAFDFLFDEKPVRAYRVTLGPGMKILLGPRKADILMIQLTGRESEVMVNLKSFQGKGDYLYIPSGHAIEIKNTGKENLPFAFFELK